MYKNKLSQKKENDIFLNNEKNIFSNVLFDVLFRTHKENVEEWYIKDRVVPAESLVNNNDFSYEEELKQLIFESRARDLIFVIGEAGSGKTTFVNYVLSSTEKSLGHNEISYLRIDLSKTGYPFSEKRNIENNLDIIIHEKITKFYPEFDSEPACYDIWDTVEPWNTNIYQEFQKTIGEKDFKRKRLEWIIEKRKDLTSFNSVRIRYLSEKYNKTVFWLDNIDFLPKEEQVELMYLLIHKFKHHDLFKKVKVIFTCRYDTYSELKYFQSQKFYDKIATIFLRPPNISSVLVNRLNLIKKERTDIQQLNKLEIGFDRFQPLCEDIIHVFSNPVIATSLEALSNSNIRTSLHMIKRSMESHWFPWDKIFPEGNYSYDRKFTVSWPRILAGIMLGQHKFYNEKESPVLNLFGNNSSRDSSVLIRPQILSALSKVSYTSKDLLEMLLFLGYSNDQIDQALLTLLKYRLVSSNKKVYSISKLGNYYFKYLLVTFVYIELTAIDTNIDSDLLENIPPFNKIDVVTGLQVAMSLVIQVKREEESQKNRIFTSQSKNLKDFFLFQENEEISRKISWGIINDIKSISYSRAIKGQALDIINNIRHKLEMVAANK